MAFEYVRKAARSSKFFYEELYHFLGFLSGNSDYDALYYVIIWHHIKVTRGQAMDSFARPTIFQHCEILPKRIKFHVASQV